MKTSSLPDTAKTAASSQPPPPPALAQAKTARARETLTLMTAALPVAGALGTLFVWLAANFYVGDVNLTLNAPYENLTVKVYDSRGQEATFHSPRFKLMPGAYHLIVSADQSKPHHFDTKVDFQHVSNVDVDLTAQGGGTNFDGTIKKRWWQFWRKQEQ